MKRNLRRKHNFNLNRRLKIRLKNLNKKVSLQNKRLIRRSPNQKQRLRSNQKMRIRSHKMSKPLTLLLSKLQKIKMTNKRK
jgi:hypothetical protein